MASRSGKDHTADALRKFEESGPSALSLHELRTALECARERNQQATVQRVERALRLRERQTA